MFGRVEGKSRDVVRIGGVPDETASSMCIEGDHEEKCEVVGIPESLEALAADLVMGGRVHDDHDEQHEVTSDATSLFVMDILCGDLPDLCIRDKTEARAGGLQIKCLRVLSTLIKLT